MNTVDRLPPCDIDSEEALLGSMLMNPTGIVDALRVIPVDKAHWLYGSNHAVLYQLIVEIVDRPDKAVDLTLMKEIIAARGLSEELPEERLIYLAESCADTANMKYYAGVVREKGLLRDLIRTADEVITGAMSPAVDFDTFIDDVESRIFAIKADRKRSEPASVFVVGTELLRVVADKTRKRGIGTGFPTYDRATGGLHPGEVTIVAARPSVGKTGLAACVAVNIAAAGVGVLFESLEMDRLSVGTRIACARAKVDTRRVRDMECNEIERYRLDDAIQSTHDMPLYINDVPGMTILELRADIRAAVVKWDVKLAVIDYLTLIRTGAKKRGQNRNDEVSDISAAIKGIARECGIPILLLAQLNRASAENNAAPELHHLRDSGAIEQDADVVLMLWRKLGKGQEDGTCDMAAIDEARRQADAMGQPLQLISTINAAIRKNRNGPLAAFEGAAELAYSKYTEQSREPSGGSAPRYNEPAAAPYESRAAADYMGDTF